MFILAKKTLHLKTFWAFGAATFYALSPFVYSRLIAGHLTMILAYALLPLIIFFLSRGEKKDILALILIFPLFFSHLNLAFLALTVLFVSLLFFLKRFSLKRLGVFFLGLILITAYLWLPTVTNLGGKKSFFLKEEALISGAAPQEDSFRKGSASFSQLVSLSLPQNLYTEFVYPFFWPKIDWVAVVLFFFFALGGLIVNRKEKKTWLFFILFFLGGLGSLGSHTFIGRKIFSLLVNLAPTISAGFDNPPRFLPLYFLGFFPLAFLFLNNLEEGFLKPRKKYLRGSLIAGGLLFLSPWWSGGLCRPVYPESYLPFSLTFFSPSPKQKEIFDFLKKEGEGYRVAYFPSVNVVPPTKEETLLRWQSQFPPQPNFLGNVYPELSKQILLQIFSPSSLPQTNQLLAMASIKFLIWDEIGPFGAYQTFGFFPLDTNYQSIVKKNLFSLFPDGFKNNLPVYQFENPYPMVYLPRKIVVTNNPDENLLPLLANNFLGSDPVLLSDRQEYYYQADLVSSVSSDPTMENGQAVFTLNIVKAGSYRFLLKKPGENWEKVEERELAEGESKISFPLPKQENLLGPWQKTAADIYCAKISAKNEPNNYRLLGDYSFLGQEKNAYLVIAGGEPLEELGREKVISWSDLTPAAKEAKIDLGFSLREGELPSRLCVVNNNRQQLKIKELKLFTFYQPELLVVKDLASSRVLPEIIFQKISPSRYRVTVKNARQPFFLVLNQSYHPDWQIFDQKEPLAAGHFLANTFANGWLIEKTGDYQIILEFLPQRKYRFGLAVSASTFLGMILFFLKSACVKKRSKVE